MVGYTFVNCLCVYTLCVLFDLCVTTHTQLFTFKRVTWTEVCNTVTQHTLKSHPLNSDDSLSLSLSLSLAKSERNFCVTVIQVQYTTVV